MTGAEAIVTERKHQTDKGWDSSHDDMEHEERELVKAAIGFAASVFPDAIAHKIDSVLLFPWDKEDLLYDDDWLLPRYKHSPKQRLVIAGALLAAEYDRLERMEI